MMERKVTVTAGALVALAMLVAGFMLGRVTAPAAGPAGQSSARGTNKDAETRAVAFYKAHWLGQNYAAAWDMSLPGTFPDYGTKEEYVKRRTELLGGPQPDRPFQLQEFKRSQDYLYLISESGRQVMVWVTPAPSGWKVRRFERYDGGPVPW